ncbi:MAG: N-methyl-L-tryptophan oxidase [Caldilineaceae bacterium]|nr:N-methyl-L-tryptophan oxidase [Caldilineaceae bacterium]MDE0338535.1 N-methyl-L-tryptophan oxidase [Caldilineaceae bacterium]
MRDAEILVVGLGGMGSAALYHLARRGVAALGIEQFQIGHALGSSHGFSRIYRNFYDDALYVELAEAALPLWQELEALSAQKLLHLTGLLYFARPGNDNIEERMGVMQALKRPYERLTAQEVTARFPALQLPARSVACLTPQAGFLDAGQCVLAQLKQAERFGATIHDQVRVDSVDLSQDAPVVETSAGQYRCERLIISPGPWASEILEELALPLRVTRQQKFYFRPKQSAPYQPGELPVYGDSDTKFYGFPDYGPGLKVADDGLGAEYAPSEVDRTLDMCKRDELQAWLESIMPGGGFSYVEGSTCMYTVTPDRDFLMGPHPRNPNVIVGAGFSGHGFKFSTLVGKILADLAADGTTDYPVERFRLDRFEKAQA